MTVEYKWQVLSLYTIPHENGLDNIVKSVNWRFQAGDGSYFGDVYDTTDLPKPSSSNSYLAYDQLDEDTVVNWVTNQIDYDDLVRQAEERLEQNRNPSVVEKDPPFKKPEKYTGEEEYVIVFNNGNVWGPMKWNSRRANNGLKENGITDYEFPFDITMYQKELLPTDVPTEPISGVKVYKVDHIEENPPEFDPIFENNPGLTWVTDSGKAVGTYIIKDRSLEDARDKLKQKAFGYSINQREGSKIPLKNELETKYIDGTLPNLVFLTSIISSLGADSNETVIVQTLDDSYIEVNYTQLKNTIDDLLNVHQSIVKNESSIIEQINKSDNTDDLKVIAEGLK